MNKNIIFSAFFAILLTSTNLVAENKYNLITENNFSEKFLNDVEPH